MVGGGLALMLMWLQELYLPMSDEWNSTTSLLAIRPFWLILTCLWILVNMKKKQHKKETKFMYDRTISKLSNWIKGLGKQKCQFPLITNHHGIIKHSLEGYYVTEMQGLYHVDFVVLCREITWNFETRLYFVENTSVISCRF